MEKEKRTKFIKEIQDLCKKYEVENCAFCGNDTENYIGLVNIDDEPNSIFATAENVGRLWQSSRTMVRNILDDYEK